MMRSILFLGSLLASAQVDLGRVKQPIAADGNIGFVRYGGKPPTMHVLRDFFANRVDPPAAAGSCWPDGRGSWATDRQFFYVCVPNEAGTDFVWARMPLQVEW